MECPRDCFSYGSIFGHNYTNLDGIMEWHSGAPETKAMGEVHCKRVEDLGNKLIALVGDVKSDLIHNFTAKTELLDIADALKAISDKL